MKQERIAQILNEMLHAAESDEVMAPDWWLNKAQVLATLWTTVTKDMVKYEQAYKNEIVNYIEEGDSVAKATLKVEAKSENYKTYRYLYKKDQQVSEIIKTAKKRVDANNFI